MISAACLKLIHLRLFFPWPFPERVPEKKESVTPPGPPNYALKRKELGYTRDTCRGKYVVHHVIDGFLPRFPLFGFPLFAYLVLGGLVPRSRGLVPPLQFGQPGYTSRLPPLHPIKAATSIHLFNQGLNNWWFGIRAFVIVNFRIFSGWKKNLPYYSTCLEM